MSKVKFIAQWLQQGGVLFLDEINLMSQLPIFLVDLALPGGRRELFYKHKSYPIRSSGSNRHIVVMTANPSQTFAAGRKDNLLMRQAHTINFTMPQFFSVYNKILFPLKPPHVDKECRLAWAQQLVAFNEQNGTPFTAREYAELAFQAAHTPKDKLLQEGEVHCLRYCASPEVDYAALLPADDTEKLTQAGFYYTKTHALVVHALSQSLQTRGIKIEKNSKQGCGLILEGFPDRKICVNNCLFKSARV